MKKIKILTSIIIVIFCTLILSSCKYIIKPHYDVNIDLPENLTSGKSLAEYAANTIEKDCGKEFNIGSVYMLLDSELKGEVRIDLVEKKQRRPLIVEVEFDTKNNKLLSFHYNTYETKIDPGIINMQNWEIDYAEAIEIAEEFFSKTEDFRYDRVIIKTCNSSPYEDEDWEDWMIDFYDYQNGKAYGTRIDPYTGEITSHYSGEIPTYS